MTLAESVEERLPRAEWLCIDVPALPRSIPHGDGEFDVALLCDVLYDSPQDAARLLGEAGRVARHVLVKDHFEHGLYSPAAFSRLVAEQRLTIVAIDCGLELDEPSGVGTPRRPDGHFIAVLSRS
jgi:hypothetical protein